MKMDAECAGFLLSSYGTLKGATDLLHRDKLLQFKNESKATSDELQGIETDLITLQCDVDAAEAALASLQSQRLGGGRIREGSSVDRCEARTFRAFLRRSSGLFCQG